MKVTITITDDPHGEPAPPDAEPTEPLTVEAVVEGDADLSARHPVTDLARGLMSHVSRLASVSSITDIIDGEEVDRYRRGGQG